MYYAYYTAPDYSAFPITTAAAKTQLQIDTTDTTHDTSISTYVETANTWMAKVLGMALASQVVDVYFDVFPADDSPIVLPFPPLTSITSIKYTDSGGTQSTFSSSYYSTDTIRSPGRAVLNYGQSWPSTTLATANPIVIRIACGYTTVASVPRPIRQMILWLVSHLFTNREPVVVGSVTTLAAMLPFGMTALIEEYRVRDFGTLWAQ